MVQDNRSILAKADQALSDISSGGGVLNPEQALKFMQIMIKNAKLLPLVNASTMQAPTNIPHQSQVPPSRLSMLSPQPAS